MPFSCYDIFPNKRVVCTWMNFTTASISQNAGCIGDVIWRQWSWFAVHYRPLDLKRPGNRIWRYLLQDRWHTRDNFGYWHVIDILLPWSWRFIHRTPNKMALFKEQFTFSIQITLEFIPEHPINNASVFTHIQWLLYGGLSVQLSRNRH